MKKTIAIILALLMLLCFAACGDDKTDMVGVTVIGGQDGPEVTATAEIVNTPAPTPVPEETPAPVETTPEPTPEPTPTPQAEPENDLKATAESFIGAALDELIAAIGEPESSDYAPSCLGDGEDGNLYYDGFVVYTYRENGTETVEYVE